MTREFLRSSAAAATHRHTQPSFHALHYCGDQLFPAVWSLDGLHDVIPSACFHLVTPEILAVMDGSILVATCTGQRSTSSHPPQVSWTACDAVCLVVCFLANSFLGRKVP